jgi:hypothetical protein
VKACDQILKYLDAPAREDKYHRTALDEMRLGDVSTNQLQHYLACRRRMEEHLDQETAFDELCRLWLQLDELCRLWLQLDEETCDAFDRIAGEEGRLARIAAGMLSDGWSEDQVRYALSTLGRLDAAA